jgi:hypothetical protein
MRIRQIAATASLVLLLLVGGSDVQTQPGSALTLKDAMTASEFERAGLHKLTAGELRSLESWLASRLGGNATPPRRLVAPPAAASEMVTFNTSTGKYHCASCTWAVRCTRNCVSMPLAQARTRGVACKVCRGSCG